MNIRYIILIILAILFWRHGYAQYPAAGTKQRLGYQTTGDGLIFRGNGAPAYTPAGLNNAWMYIDTLTRNLYAFTSGTWQLVSGGGSAFDGHVDSLVFNTNVTVIDSTAKMYWDANSETISVGVDGGAVYQLGEELYYPLVINKSGGTIYNGQCVMVDTATLVTGDKVRIILARNGATYPSSYIMGVATTDIPNDSTGLVTWFGYVREVDHADIAQTGVTLVPGNILYPSTTEPGRYTNVAPTTPAHKSTIALVVRKPSDNNMTLLVRPQLSQRLADLSDVNTSSVTGLSVLRYNSTTGVWDASATPGIVAADTASMLSPYLRKVDTLSLSNRINLKLNISDTLAMLAPYARGSSTAGRVAYWSGTRDLTGSANLTYDGFQLQNAGSIRIGLSHTDTASFVKLRDGNSKIVMIQNPGSTGSFSSGFVFRGGFNGSLATVNTMRIYTNSTTLPGSVYVGNITENNAQNVNARTNFGIFNKITTVNYADAGLNITAGSTSLQYSKNANKQFGIHIGGDNLLANFDSSAQTGVFIGMQYQPITGGFGTSVVFSAKRENAIPVEIFRLQGKDGNACLGCGGNALYTLDMNTRTDAIRFPIGTTAQRPTGAAGVVRYNSDSTKLEFHNGTAWSGLQSTITNPVTGTGTANYLSKFTGTGTIGVSQIFDNGTNLGINNASPQSKLHTLATSFDHTPIIQRTLNNNSTPAPWAMLRLRLRNETATIPNNSGPTFLFELEDNASTVNSLATLTAYKDGANNTGAMVMHTYNAGNQREIMRITSNYRVSISGSSTPLSPSYTLDIGSTDAIRLPVGTTAQQPTGAAGIVRYNSTNTALEYHNGTAWKTVANTDNTAQTFNFSINIYNASDSIKNITSPANFFLVPANLNGYCIDSYQVKALSGTGTADIQLAKNGSGANTQAISGTTAYNKDTNVTLATGDVIQGQVFNLSAGATLVGLGFTIEIKATCN